MNVRPALLLLLSAAALLLGAGHASAEPRRPNVLLIIADDLRPELGCYGAKAAHSPNIDRLAARGVRFDRAYCQYPVCNPSRTSFLTGLRPDSTRVLGNNAHFRKTLPDVVTLPQLFKQNGYRTISLGKIFHRGQTMEDLKPEMDDPASWTTSKYFQATERGHRGEGRNLTGGKLAWCRWLAAEGDDEDQPDGMIAREAVAALDAHAKEPLFLAVGFHKPHDPFVAPRKYFDLHPPEKIKLNSDPADRTRDVAHALAGGAFGEAFSAFSDVERREYLRAYLAGVSFMDAQLGKVVDALDRLKLADNTIIVFLGDHGFHLGEHGWWNKNTLFERSARAPLIIVPPGSSTVAGKTCYRTVEFLDIYPTLLDLAGFPERPGLHGKSLRPLLDEPEGDWDRPAYTQVQRGKIAGRSVRTERFRYTEWDDGKAGVELYDHYNDPGEYRNLAGDSKHDELVKQLKAMIRPM